jgi:hypothetical protein
LRAAPAITCAAGVSRARRRSPVGDTPNGTNINAGGATHPELAQQVRLHGADRVRHGDGDRLVMSDSEGRL